MSKKEEKEIEKEEKHERKCENKEQETKIKELLNDLQIKEHRIKELEEQVSNINDEYVKKVKNKMNEANVLLKQNIQDIQLKAQNEINEIKKYAIYDKAHDLINIINQYEMAISYKHNDEKIAKYQQGFKMFLTMFKSLLNDLNIKEIEIKENDEFDAKTMECIEFSDLAEFKDNCVSKILTKGYKLYDRIIKPAGVVLNKRKN